MVPAIEDARLAFEDHRWGDAWQLLCHLDPGTLDIDDLDRVATAGLLTGHDDEAFEHWARAHQVCAATGALHRAAHFGIKLAQGLSFKGDIGRCGGWVGRTARLLEEADIDCVEQGYLAHAQGTLRVFEARDITGAHLHFVEAGKIAARFAHRELATLARIGEGRMLVYLGDITAGLALLDEAMVSIEAGELSPLATGDAYCTVIDACAELFDVGRCRAWTDSLARWCDSQQDLVLYRGHCFLHRAEVLAMLGAWDEAHAEARRACEHLADPLHPTVLGAAHAIEGDLLRLVGDLDGAEGAYRRASQHGHQPQPGLALLRLAQRRIGAADAMIRRVLGETVDTIPRARLLDAYVEIVLAAGDIDAARTAADELREVATELRSPMLRAAAARAAGAVLLADNRTERALVELRRAFNDLHALDLRPDAARTRLLIAQACEDLGDHDTAVIESAAARAVHESLCGDLPEPTRTTAPGNSLTPRELEVLRLLAQGKTNRAIAHQLVVSEKTVASHVSHIFTKLDVSSRSAATAYAYDHELI